MWHNVLSNRFVRRGDPLAVLCQPLYHSPRSVGSFRKEACRRPLRAEEKQHSQGAACTLSRRGCDEDVRCVQPRTDTKLGLV